MFIPVALGAIRLKCDCKNQDTSTLYAGCFDFVAGGLESYQLDGYGSPGGSELLMVLTILLAGDGQRNRTTRLSKPMKEMSSPHINRC